MYESSKALLQESIEMIRQDLATLGTSKRDVKKRAEYEQTLQNMERALAKFDQGTYGVCERCGKPIEEDLLAQFPSVGWHEACPAA